MKCTSCRRSIASGIEAKRMILAYQQTDGTLKVFGLGAPDGPLSAAVGRLVDAWHSRCWHAERKRESRGIAGTVLGLVASSYDIASQVITREELEAMGLTEEQARERTAYLSDQVAALRAIAEQVGKPVGDPWVSEAFQASLHDGPYSHVHRLRFGLYQLRAHLVHAHGYHVTIETGATLTNVHARLHTERTSDWREQSTAEL